jgi:long-subunit fatty acid transport protein
LISESDNWSFEYDSDVKVYFNGNYVKAVPIGEQVVRLKSSKEVYVIARSTTMVRNILLGTTYNE